MVTLGDMYLPIICHDGRAGPTTHLRRLRVSTSSSRQAPRAHLPGDGAGAAIHDSRALLLAWVAVFFMIIGFGLIVLALPVHSARVPLLIAGGVIGVTGVAVAAFGKIMDNVE